MSRFGLIGGSYVPASSIGDCERSLNLVPQIIESPHGKSAIMLNSSPGLGLFGTLPKAPTRGQFCINDRQFGLGDRFFMVAGDSFYEVFHDGDHQERGTVVPGSSPVSLCSNGFEILIVCAPGAIGTANVFLYDLQSGNFAPVDALTSPDGTNVIVMGTSLGGYFVGMVGGTRQFRLSALNDGTTWDPADVGTKEGGSDNLSAIIADHDELILYGTRTLEVWANMGGSDFPFQRIPGAFVEQGNGAQFSPTIVDNSLCWVGGDDRGNGIVWRMNGTTPVRISDHGIETAIQGYPRLSDCEGYAYQDGGQTFLVLRFPSAQATWVYDFSTKLWHERGWWNISQNAYQAHRGRFHSFVFGKHIVGDWQTGKMYWMHRDFTSDDGNPIRRLRTSPHVAQEMKQLTHTQVILDMQVGVGGSPQEPTWDQETQQWQNVNDTWDSLMTEGGVNPKMMMRWSDDGGKTWSPEFWRTIGEAGKYRTRVQWGRLGTAIDRVYQFVIADAVKVAIADGYLDYRMGTR